MLPWGHLPSQLGITLIRICFCEAPAIKSCLCFLGNYSQNWIHKSLLPHGLSCLLIRKSKRADSNVILKSTYHTLIQEPESQNALICQFSRIYF